jgi:hypothetical protein
LQLFKPPKKKKYHIYFNGYSLKVFYPQGV